MKHRTRLFALACLLPAACAQAQELAGAPSLRLSGFGTLGLTKADAPPGWGFLREFTQPANDGGLRADIDSRLGLQANLALSERVEAIAQVVVKDRVRGAKASDSIEWAFVAWRPDAQTTLRVGRLTPNVYFGADLRNVGFAYVPLRPPLEFYGVLPLQWVDGADLERTWTSGDTRWQARLTGGFNSRLSVERVTGSGPVPYTFDSAVAASLTRLQAGLALKATLARVTIEPGFSATRAQSVQALRDVAALPVPSVAAEAAALADSLVLSRGVVTFAALGADYMLGSWRLVAEGARLGGDFGFMNGSYGYALASRQFGALTPYAMAGRARARGRPMALPRWQGALSPLIGPAAAAQAQALGAAVVERSVNGSRFDQSSLALGLRWDLHPQMALKTQWERVRVRPNGSGLWANATTQGAVSHVGSVALDFVF